MKWVRAGAIALLSMVAGGCTCLAEDYGAVWQELRWVEDQGGMSERSRHRLLLVFPVHGLRPLRSVFLAGEIFYDYTEHEVTEYRFVPPGLTFRLSRRVDLSVFYGLQMFRSDGEWNNRHIVNTLFSIAL